MAQLQRAGPGAIFQASAATLGECLSKQLFGAPRGQWASVVRHCSAANRTAIFLYCISDKKLHGVFDAVGEPGLRLDRDAWAPPGGATRFPAQVRVARREHSLIRRRELPFAEHRRLTMMRGRVKGILTEAEVLALLELFALNSNASASAAPAPSLAPALIAASEPDEAEAVAARAIEAQRELALASAKQRAEQRGVERRLREAALKSAALRHKAPASSRASSYASSRTPVDLEPFLASLAKRFEETTTATTTVGAAAAATEAVAAAATDGTAMATAGDTRSTTATAEGVAAAVISADSTEPALATTTPRLLRRPATMTWSQWRNYKKVSKRLARNKLGPSCETP